MEDTRFKAIRMTLSTLVLITILLSLIAPVVAGDYEDGGADGEIGVLVIAHGSPSESWCSPVRNATDEVNLPYPVELGFLEFVQNETINLAVERLTMPALQRSSLYRSLSHHTAAISRRSSMCSGFGRRFR